VTFPLTWDGPQFKADLIPKKKAKSRKRRQSVSAERQAKQQAKARDGGRCRFPGCGCHALGLKIESSHLVHKGIGGNPSGDRSTTAGLMTLCSVRHRTGQWARDNGRLRYVPLTGDGCDGPVKWQIRDAGEEHWFTVASETAIGVVGYACWSVLEKMALDLVHHRR
jgi:hypothetical protein